MSDKQETIADIEEALRHEEDFWLESGQECPDRRFERYADRLKAARMREATAEKSSAVGNCAKMREALKKCRHVIHCAKLSGILRGGDAYDVMNVAGAALAAPPRNCDVGTAEEQAQRFDCFCKLEKGDCGRCPLWVSGTIGHNCELRWAQMPYESEVPDGK